MATKRSGSITLGVLLIAVGLILTLTRVAPVQTAPAWLLGLGLAFSLLGIVQRRYASLVAGMVLLGLGAGMVLGDLTALGLPMRAWRLLGLGLGFLGISAIAVLVRLGRHWWPLVPGVVLVAISLAPFLREVIFIPPQVEIAIRTWWPVALIAGGVALVARALRR